MGMTLLIERQGENMLNRRQMKLAEEYHMKIMRLKRIKKGNPVLYERLVKELQDELRQSLKVTS